MYSIGLCINGHDQTILIHHQMFLIDSNKAAQLRVQGAPFYCVVSKVLLSTTRSGSVKNLSKNSTCGSASDIQARALDHSIKKLKLTQFWPASWHLQTHTVPYMYTHHRYPCTYTTTTDTYVYDGACLKHSIWHIQCNEWILQAYIRCMQTKEQKEGIVRFVCTRCTQKSHVTWAWHELTKGSKGIHNHRIQVII